MYRLFIPIVFNSLILVQITLAGRVTNFPKYVHPSDTAFESNDNDYENADNNYKTTGQINDLLVSNNHNNGGLVKVNHYRLSQSSHKDNHRPPDYNEASTPFNPSNFGSPDQFSKESLAYFGNQAKAPTEYQFNVNSFPFNMVLTFIKNSPQLKSQILWFITSVRSIVQLISKHIELANEYLTSSSNY
ncbi:hypothetical protein G9C98_003739 [Cotesia typhae]|uniref:Uncharacterized protein n=1 Tax=Cotesia typhae TaxID=2053667 RepID=A0A8J5QUU4_9HYME|nr:hypothetical protein G9C98_003739 [Cotesia typhae]